MNVGTRNQKNEKKKLAIVNLSQLESYVVKKLRYEGTQPCGLQLATH